MLSLRAVNQFYGSQHTLWNVNIDFPQGICTGIVGLRHGQIHAYELHYRKGARRERHHHLA